MIDALEMIEERLNWQAAGIQAQYHSSSPSEPDCSVYAPVNFRSGISPQNNGFGFSGTLGGTQNKYCLSVLFGGLGCWTLTRASKVFHFEK